MTTRASRSPWRVPSSTDSHRENPMSWDWGVILAFCSNAVGASSVLWLLSRAVHRDLIAESSSWIVGAILLLTLLKLILFLLRPLRVMLIQPARLAEMRRLAYTPRQVELVRDEAGRALSRRAAQQRLGIVLCALSVAVTFWTSFNPVAVLSVGWWLAVQAEAAVVRQQAILAAAAAYTSVDAPTVPPVA